MEVLSIVSPFPGALVRWRTTVFVHTQPVRVPFMLYVFQNDNVWHRQPVPAFRGHAAEVGMYEQRCYFGDEGTDTGKNYQIVALLSHRELPGILETLPADILHSEIVNVVRR